ncbi:helix-turn-helix transcriptional regulator [Streptomyces sp. NPDC089919]|uniref:helix-turn-helix transcriptional regulator n=1 Tax=Streptomyces sp. NPDC089919 TaxID=3155188 RepID=UPI003445105B
MKPISTKSHPTWQFAFALRELRASAGNPTLARIAEETGVSISSLSQALGGDRAPTWRVTVAVVGTCGGDETTWRVLWEELQRNIRKPVELPPGGDDEGRNLSPEQRREAAWPRVWDRWKRTGIITPPLRAHSELDLIMALRCLREFRSMSLRDLGRASNYAHSTFGLVLSGGKPVTTQFLGAFLEACRVHTQGEWIAWLQLLAAAVPKQKTSAEVAMMRKMGYVPRRQK